MSVRLTKEIRESVVAKIMAQVPRVDHADLIGKMLNETARSLAPPEIVAMWGTPLWAYVGSQVVSISNEGPFRVSGLPHSHHDRLTPTHPDPVWRQLWDAFAASGLRGATEIQRSARRNMEAKLLKATMQTTTVEGLRKVLSPDLHQFVPIVAPSSAINLPVPALVAELKAMGMTFSDTVQP